MPCGKRTLVAESINRQIEKAQEKVMKTKAVYDSAVEHLQIPLDKRDAQRKDDIWDAIIKSKKTYEEIMKFIQSDPGDER